MTKDKLNTAAALLGRKGGKSRARKYTREELGKMNPRALSPEKVALLFQLDGEGVPAREIAKQLGVKPITVYKRLQRWREQSSAPEKGGA